MLVTYFQSVTLRFFIITICFILIAACNKKQESEDLRSFERNLQEFPNKLISRVTSDSLPVRPSTIKISGGEVFVSDFYSMTIYRFNKDWELLNVVGAGYGRGPGEIQNITDYIIAGDTLIVADVQSFCLHYFKLDGTFLYQREVRNRPLRIAAANGMATLLTMGGEGLFVSDVLHGRSDINGSYVQFSEKQQRNIISYDGSLISDGETIIYLPRYFSNWYKIDPLSKSYVTAGYLPDGQELDFKNENYRVSRAPDHLRINYTGVALNNDTLIIASYDKGVQNEKEEYEVPWKMYLDYYNVKNGDYLHSYRFPGWFYTFDMEGNRMVMTLNDKLLDITFTDRPVKQ